ncbi:hypothetical protein NDU88_004517 [Pleurodeles waltl]|uniref:Uncharacterized protein n=1 Tax=Pleurodeles waltl TaxID=8319 RepID=A0AAV7NJW8_PLEWA|nr:hypothetical protein NDU88_004517 [Pleurodeles waltl]
MAEDAKVREAFALLKQAGRMDLVREEALAPGTQGPGWSSSGGCGLFAVAGIQVKGIPRGVVGMVWKGAVGVGKGTAGRRTREFRWLPLGRGALRL